MRTALVFAAAALVATTASAQTPATAAAIDSGMTKAQVVERLGAPGIERTRGNFTYLFYSNGLERQVGMNDLVVLLEDRVIDAIFRSPRRSYSGRSTSPRAIPPQEAAKMNRSGTMRVDTLPVPRPLPPVH